MIGPNKDLESGGIGKKYVLLLMMSWGFGNSVFSLN